MKVKTKYVVRPTYGYGAIDVKFSFMKDDGGQVLRTLIAGIKPQKLADKIADLLNSAYAQGVKDATGEWPEVEE